MLSAKSVIPECCIDSCLFDVLLSFEKESVNHTKGNATVINKMEYKFADLFCIGIIDKDRRDLEKVKNDFDRIEINDTEDYFRLHKHKTNKHHYLIQMVPAIEEWICNVANQLGLSLSDFNIHANTSKELAQVTKKVDKKDDPRFKALFKRFLKESAEKNFLPLLKLKKIIVLIKDKNYQLDENELRNA